MNVRFNGIGDLVATFQTASAELGDVVKISENGTVEKACLLYTSDAADE